MKKITGILLSFLMLFCLLPQTVYAVDDSRSYHFDLSVDSQYEVQANTGDIITVTLILERTDSAEASDMYAMQAEMLYDDTFFELIKGSVMTSSGIEWTDMARRDGGRAFYMNFVSFSGGEVWDSKVQIGTFQMSVIGESGVSMIRTENCLVSTKDGNDSFLSESNDVAVILTSDCKVTFEENGGSEVPDQIVQYGELIEKPEDPVREGYTFHGWYSNLDRTEEWDFKNDTVKGNMTLYADWTEGVFEATSSVFPWWIILLLILFIILLFLLFSKKVKFDTKGGSKIRSVRVRKGSLINEPPVPVKNGFTFLGWYQKTDGTEPWDFENDKVEKNMTLYAYWKRN